MEIWFTEGMSKHLALSCTQAPALQASDQTQATVGPIRFPRHDAQGQQFGFILPFITRLILRWFLVKCTYSYNGYAEVFE